MSEAATDHGAVALLLDVVLGMPSHLTACCSGLRAPSPLPRVLCYHADVDSGLIEREARERVCIHCGRMPDEHVRLPTPERAPRALSMLYCDAERRHVYEAWWMR